MNDFIEDFLAIIFVIIIVCFVPFLPVAAFFNFNMPSTGEKQGLIVKVAEEGFLFKTIEAEIIRGGFQDGSGANGKSFHFTVPRNDYENLSITRKALEGGHPIKITYHCEMISSVTRSSTGCFLDKINEYQH